MATSAASASSIAPNHTWRFRRKGGLDQVVFDQGDDYRNLRQLDQKLWVALACPVKGLEFDEATLRLIDADGDGRVRAPEVIAAVEWACARLKDPAEMRREPKALPLASIDDRTPAGAELLAAARRILSNLGKPGAAEITVAEVSDNARIFSGTAFNGDAVITPASAGADAATAGLIGEVIAHVGGVPDRSGALGVDGAKVDAFFAALQAYDTWAKAGEAPAGSDLRPLGDATGAAWAAYQAVRSKVEDYFARCRLAGYDPRAIGHLNRAESEYVALAARDLSVPSAEIEALPVAQVAAGKGLPLLVGVNPAWMARIADLRDKAVYPLLKVPTTQGTLSEREWQDLGAKLAPYGAWLAAKPGGSIESLGLPRIRALLAGQDAATLHGLLGQDRALAPELAGIDGVARLTRYYCHLHSLLINFVTFADFYDQKDPPAIFQAGTLFLDSRSCDLCLRVDAAGAHAGMAALSKMYIAYCECTRPGGEKMTIAACFTQGDSDYLMVGRNGLFYDRQGRDWDARVVQIIDNPISIKQAFWSPYKKFVRFIEEQVSKRAAAADAASTAKLETAATTVATADQAAAKQPPKRFDVGTVAALGVAVSGITGVLTAIVGGILGLSWWQIPLAVLGVFLAISGPSMLIAYLKLRQRVLGPALDANGWAINGRVKINVPFGTRLTKDRKLPANSALALTDPYEEESAAPRFIFWGLVLVIAGLATVGYLRWEAKQWPFAPAEAAPAAETGAPAP